MGTKRYLAPEVGGYKFSGNYAFYMKVELASTDGISIIKSLLLISFAKNMVPVRVPRNNEAMTATEKVVLFTMSSLY